MRAVLRLTAALLLAAASSPAATVDEDLVPGGTVLSTIFPAAEVETFRVAAPAGSALSVDLRPLRKGLFAPILEATLSDGSGALLPGPGRTGKTKAALPFPVDGVLELRVRSGRGGAGDYRLKTRLRPAKGPDFSGSVNGAEGADIEFAAPAGVLATVKVKAAPGSPLVPRILDLEGPGGPATAGGSKPGAASDLWTKIPLVELGPCTLTVGGAEGTQGAFTGSVRWKPPKGPSEDRRDALAPSALQGSYAALLAPTPSGPVPPPFLMGGITFDGKGGLKTDLASLVPSADASAPLGFALGQTPVAGHGGGYVTDGAAASVSLDLGNGTDFDADFAVAAGGSILHAGVADPAAPVHGMLLERVEKPTALDLAGPWLYVNATGDGSGAGTVEIGTLTLAPGGAVSGAGLRTAVTLVDGVPTPGAQSPVLRTGSFSVGADGTVTLVTVPNLFNPAEAWTAGTVYGADVLAGIEPDGSGGRLLLKQGLGLTDADASGDYLHFGLAAGSGLSLRTGLLAFDGSGAFAGEEAVTSLSGASAGTGESVTGTYSVSTSGLATFGIDGAAEGTGIVGPGARYLFTVGFDGSGLNVDFLLSLE
jgi:hypothetical protein